MIKPIERSEIPECASLIRDSFRTVADELGFTEENAPRFTAFATNEQRLGYQYENEPRIMVGYYLDSGVIAGYYSVLWQDNNECELNNLCVRPEYRHCGLGRELLEDSFSRAKEKGYRVMNIGIVEENAVLRHWYEANGFTHTGTRKFDFFPFTCGYMKKYI